MVLVKYNPDKQSYISAFQNGGGERDAFKGVLFQRGFGIFRKIRQSPLLMKIKPHAKKLFNKAKPILKTVGQELVKSGAEGIKDILVNKRTPKASLNNQREAIKRKLTSAALNALNMTGSGAKKPKVEVIRKKSQKEKGKAKHISKPKNNHTKKNKLSKIKSKKKNYHKKNKLSKNKSVTKNKKERKKDLSKSKTLKHRDIFS